MAWSSDPPAAIRGQIRWWRVAAQAAEDMVRFVGEFGLTPGGAVAACRRPWGDSNHLAENFTDCLSERRFDRVQELKT
jgi:hypothetical protein